VDLEEEGQRTVGADAVEELEASVFMLGIKGGVREHKEVLGEGEIRDWENRLVGHGGG
jgi:hypothetical protein